MQPVPFAAQRARGQWVRFVIHLGGEEVSLFGPVAKSLALLRGQCSCFAAHSHCMQPHRCQTALPVGQRGDPWHRAPGPVLFHLSLLFDFGGGRGICLGRTPIPVRPAPTRPHGVLGSASLASAASRSELCVVVRPWVHPTVLPLCLPSPYSAVPWWTRAHSGASVRGRGGGRFIRRALDLPASWFLRILAGARTLKRRLSAAWAHSRGSGDATDGFSAAGVENRRRMQMPATSWGVLYPNAWARNGWSSSASQGMSLCAIGSRVRVCVGIRWLGDPPPSGVLRGMGGHGCHPLRSSFKDSHKGQGESQSHSLNDRQR